MYLMNISTQFMLIVPRSVILALPQPQLIDQLADISITLDEVYQVLSTLNIDKAPGSDNIGPMLSCLSLVLRFSPIHYIICFLYPYEPVLSPVSGNFIPSHQFSNQVIKKMLKIIVQSHY